MPEASKSYIVFDANILIKDFWLSGNSFKYLRSRRFLDHTPIIPEVSFLEARSNLRLRAHDLLLKMKNETNDFSKTKRDRLYRLFNFDPSTHQDAFDVDYLLTRWEDNLRNIILEANGRFITIPEIDIKVLVQRSVDRSKPFSRGDRGFRDTLIWLSTIGLLEETPFLSFITANTDDFYEKDKVTPHRDLLSEAKEITGEYFNVQLFKSLDEFISFIDSNKEASSGALHRALISEDLSRFSLWEWLETNVIDLIECCELDGVSWAGIPEVAENPSLNSLEELTSLDVSQVEWVDGDNYRIYFDFSIVGHFQCSIPLDLALNVVHKKQILWKDETDDIWTEVGIRATGTFLGFVDLNINSFSISSYYARVLQHWVDYKKEIKNLIDNYTFT